MENANTSQSRAFNIIVPVYSKLEHFEEVSIRALFSHLSVDKKRDVWFILPGGDNDTRECLLGFLDKELNLKPHTDFYIKEYNKKWFKSKYDYSKLLLTHEFYRGWYEAGYRKSFIYQTDCYLFRDEFDKWANTGYTFVGAPVVATNSDWGYYGGYVGNGGFSMRDNYKLYLLLYRDENNKGNELWEKHGEEFETAVLEKNSDLKYIDFEDIFICRMLSKYAHIDIPSAKEASKFAYDRNPFDCKEFYNVACPMVAHNFMLQAEYWSRFIPELDKGSGRFDKELFDVAQDIIDKWNSSYHPEEHGKQVYNDDVGKP